MFGSANAMSIDQNLQLDLSVSNLNPFSSAMDSLAEESAGYDLPADRARGKAPALVTPGIDHTHNRRTEVFRIGVL